MSLRARIRRLEDAVEWLRYEGRVLLAARQLEVFYWNDRLEEGWERHLLARERAEAMARAVRERPQPAAKPEPKTVGPDPVALEAASPADSPAEIAPDPWAALTDVPEDKLVRPITWRQRGPDDWEDDDVPSVLTEYDPLAECDSS